MTIATTSSRKLEICNILTPIKVLTVSSKGKRG
jgi:hypothetical protein